LLQRIGEGGHGLVYLAEQSEPVRRKVALKIIRLGMDTEKVIARFEIERQSLALMDHPNIARVLDAGTTHTGRPYFVMELVDGEKITTFCDQHSLNIRRRLELFVQVCQAIQHAHQKGIIHRDLKPSNILVRRQDHVVLPKVIDFGIAKATVGSSRDDISLTAVDQFLGTPAYTSPEMISGGSNVDTRTDIHGLGGILYELLTGRAPFDPDRLAGLSPGAICDILCDEDPLPPSHFLASLQSTKLDATAAARGTNGSRLILTLKGDLDWIVMKALHRNRDRRYETANGLAMDVIRYLQDEPVSARPPDRLYTLVKLARRNRIPFLFGGTAFVLLAVGFSISTMLFIRENEARALQEKLKLEADIARENETKLRAAAEHRELIARAAVKIEYGDIQGGDRLLASVPVELAPSSLEAARAYTKAGQWHVEAGRWKEATDRFASAALAITAVDPSDSDAISINLIPATAALVLSGDIKRYERLRTIAIERFKSTTHPLVAEQVVKSSLLLPIDNETSNEIKPIAAFLEKAIVEKHSELVYSNERLMWGNFAVALLKYRLGEFESARDQALRCLTSAGSIPSRDASCQCLIAMVMWKQGKHNEARDALKSPQAKIDEVFSQNLKIGDYNSYWFDWVVARILCREAQSMISDH
jgi:eukaryotic-like serine/threonine-protein kinase